MIFFNVLLLIGLNNSLPIYFIKHFYTELNNQLFLFSLPFFNSCFNFILILSQIKVGLSWE